MESEKIRSLSSVASPPDEPRHTQNLTIALRKPFPRVGVFRPASRGNQRLIAQQALFLISNVVEVEDFLRWREIDDHRQYLEIVDIPAREGRRALADLAYMGVTHATLMGVTHATLFPGLDGVGRYLKLRRFFLP
jgi:hypothetical protein